VVILVHFDAEGLGYVLGDAHAAETRMGPLDLDDGGDEFRRRAFGTVLSVKRQGREELAVLAGHQRLVEFEQSCRPE
jgi:hypothetical protein